MELTQRLRRILDEAPTLIERLPDPGYKSSPDRWSQKEKLGHLIDSAANNHQRIVRVQLEQQPAMPGYEQGKWVELHSYQHRDWPEL
jgi:hypothetical protein